MVAPAESLESIILAEPLPKGKVLSSEEFPNLKEDLTLLQVDPETGEGIALEEAKPYYELRAMIGMLTHFCIQDHLDARPDSSESTKRKREKVSDGVYFMRKFIDHINSNNIYKPNLGQEIYSYIDVMAKEIAEEMKSEIVEGYSAPIFIAEVPIVGEPPEILNYLISSENKDNLELVNKYLRDNKLFTDVDDLARALINSEQFRLDSKDLRTLLEESATPFDIDNPGTPLEQIQHLVTALSNYSHIDFRDNPPQTLADIERHLREVIVTTSVKPDILGIRVKKGDIAASKIVYNFRLAIEGTLFGYTRIGDHRAMLNKNLPDGTIALDAVIAFRDLILDDRIQLQLHEIKVDPTIKKPEFRDKQIEDLGVVSDEALLDIGYTAFGLKNYLHAVSLFRRPEDLNSKNPGTANYQNLFSATSRSIEIDAFLRETLSTDIDIEAPHNKDGTFSTLWSGDKLHFSTSLVNVALPIVYYKVNKLIGKTPVAWRPGIDSVPQYWKHRRIEIPAMQVRASINHVKEKIIELRGRKKIFREDVRYNGVKDLTVFYDDLPF